MNCCYAPTTEAGNVFNWLQFIVICVTLAVAAYAGARSMPASLSSRLRKQLSQQAVDIEALVSESARLTQLVRTISNRLAVREHREKKLAEVPLDADAEPPKGATKAELRKFYGLPSDPRGFVQRVRELDKRNA